MEMQTLRFWFSKTGRAKYISHLDLMRAMTRAFRQARLPVWYTEGFHPHLHLTFGQPLSLGFESECEPMEVKATSPIDPKEAVRTLNSVLPTDIRVYGCEKPEQKLEKLVFSEYRIILRYEDGSAPDAEQYSDFIRQDEIPVEKKTKRGVASFNLAPLLEMTRAEKTASDTLVITAVLPCGPQNHVNPQLVSAAFAGYTGTAPIVSVRRTAVFDGNLKTFGIPSVMR